MTERPIERETWMRRNAIPLATAVISLAVMLATFGATYGRVVMSMANYETELAAYRTELAKVEVHIAEINNKVDNHHTDTERHIDKRQWDLLQKQIESINENLRLHRQRTGS